MVAFKSVCICLFVDHFFLLEWLASSLFVCLTTEEKYLMKLDIKYYKIFYSFISLGKGTKDQEMVLSVSQPSRYTYVFFPGI